MIIWNYLYNFTKNINLLVKIKMEKDKMTLSLNY